MSRKKILWLCSWYPNKGEPFNGDFIQRHARAAALYNDIHVIHLAADSTGRTTGNEFNLQTTAGLTEQIIYYKKGSSVWGRLRAHYHWIFLYRQALRNLVIRNGKPDLVHVQVPMKAGIIGIWFMKRYRVPYLVTEHWGIYNSVAEDNYEKRGAAFRYYTRRIFKYALRFASVSRYLAEGVNKLVIEKNYEVIPNVADTRLFFFEHKSSGAFRFIHVSNMVPLKNPEGILRAFAGLHRQHNNTELVMVGEASPAVRSLATSLGLPDGAIVFRGEVSYEQVALEMQQANCLVLFSDIENSPCVIGEALCCGMPVIATQVGGIPELVDESNSILVLPGDEIGLAAAMSEIMDIYPGFNRAAIAEKAAGRFSYETAGRKLDAIYSSILENKP